MTTRASRILRARHRLALVLLLVALGSSRRASACASCGCGDPTLTATGVERPYKNRLRVGIEARYASFTQGEGLGAQDVQFIRTTLAATWSPISRLTFALQLPWVTSWIKPATQPRVGVTGLGDLELSVRGVLFQERRFAPHHLLWASAGLKFPTGYRAYDGAGYPFPDDEQPGTGSWDPFFGLTYAWFSGELLSVFVSSSYRQTNDGWRGYRRGSSVGNTAAVQIQPWGWGAFQVGADVIWQEPDHFSNNRAVPDTGGTVGYVAIAFLANPYRDLLLRASVDAPALTVLDGKQKMGPQVSFSITYDIK